MLQERLHIQREISGPAGNVAVPVLAQVLEMVLGHQESLHAEAVITSMLNSVVPQNRNSSVNIPKFVDSFVNENCHHHRYRLPDPCISACAWTPQLELLYSYFCEYCSPCVCLLGLSSHRDSRVDGPLQEVSARRNSQKGRCG